VQEVNRLREERRREEARRKREEALEEARRKREESLKEAARKPRGAEQKSQKERRKPKKPRRKQAGRKSAAQKEREAELRKREKKRKETEKKRRDTMRRRQEIFAAAARAVKEKNLEHLHEQSDEKLKDKVLQSVHEDVRRLIEFSEAGGDFPLCPTCGTALEGPRVRVPWERVLAFQERMAQEKEAIQGTIQEQRFRSQHESESEQREEALIISAEARVKESMLAEVDALVFQDSRNPEGYRNSPCEGVGV